MSNLKNQNSMQVTTPSDYWISPKAITIQLNAMGDADYIQASVAAGAQILCYVKGVDGLEFDAGHNYKHWPLKISPTYFTTETRKFVYVAIPRNETVGSDAQVVFPSEQIDVYGCNAAGEQKGGEDYYYIWLQGIISAKLIDGEHSYRQWEEDIQTGLLDSDEAYSAGGDGTWWFWDAVTDKVTFLKTIAYAVFDYLKAAQADIHNLNVTGTFDAVKGYIDDLRSHNYSQGLLDGSGWRLTNDNGEGGSELEVDFLKVRKKATFMELEIRKETFVGGNQHYSPAGSILYQVDYLDENDEKLGYTVMKVPFLLKRFAFLGRIFNYAARKKIKRQLSEDEWRQCHHIRCYLLADDGTTATRNWWQVGDQPRCQAFNRAVSVQNKRDHTYNAHGVAMVDPATPEPIETAYWWRLITNTGSEKLEDGHVYDFFDVPYEGWYGYTDDEKRSFRDAGSDIPVAGDTAVCMGNRYNEERMNMVSIYTTGSDNHPPAIRGRRGIHSFNFENTLVFEVSPEQVLFRSKDFKFFDDSGYEFPVPLERGEWQRGLRYHWYDRVSWAGSIWLCQVLDDYVWENASGTEYPAYQVEDIEYGEGNFQYSVHIAGDEIVTGTDHYYRTGTVNGQIVYYIKLYTYSEPSDLNQIWLKEIDKGRNGMDGDGVEYVFIRTADNTTPIITNSSDEYDGKTYLDDDYLPLSDAGRCTDDPQGVTKALPYEWVAKRTKADPDPETGERIWHKYGEGQYEGRMALWATYSENSVKLDLDNEMDMVLTDSTGKVQANRSITTHATLFDGTSIGTSASLVTSARDIVIGGVTPSLTIANGVVTAAWSFTTSNTLSSAATVSITVNYKNVNYTAQFTVAPSMGQAVWQLKPQYASLSFSRNASDVLSPSYYDVGLTVLKIDGSSTSDVASSTYGLSYIRYAFDSMPASASAGTAWPSGSLRVYPSNGEALNIALFSSAGVLIDRESIPIVRDGIRGEKGEKGDKGDKGDQGNQGSAGHVGRWYYFAGEWQAGVEYLFEATKAPYVKRGSNYYMLDYASDPTTQQSSATARTTRDPANYNSGNPWSNMTAVFKYIITEAMFTQNAYLGSFIINNDWMISQHGTKNGAASTDYTAFDPNHPNDNTGSNFIPNFAVDGKTGNSYQNKAYIGVGTTNKITLGPTLNGTGASIEGTHNNDQRLFFGFNLGYGKIKAASDTHQYVEMINDASFSGVHMVKEITTTTPSELRDLYVGVNNAGKIVLKVPSTEVGTANDMWKSESEATKGEVYVSPSGYLMLKK